eukprot:2683170-Ditylum_brightwellii.AAC.1
MLTVITRKSVSNITQSDYDKSIQVDSQEATEILRPVSGDKKVYHIVAKGMVVVDVLHGLDLKQQLPW